MILPLPSGVSSLIPGRAARRWIKNSMLVALGLFVAGSSSSVPAIMGIEEFNALYADPLPQPQGPMRVFHLGHSLVGRDMPAMLAQLAPKGHAYESQLGWGTTLQAHWGPKEGINGFASENNHPRYRDVREALESGEYDAFVMTEMVEIRDAIRYFDSWDYARRWAELARKHRPDIRVYLYETWSSLDDPEGWLERLDLDADRYWEGEILRRALSPAGEQRQIYVIPAGRVMARVVREIEAGRIPGLSKRENLFRKDSLGKQDTIHINDYGSYLVALTHYAVLYQCSPEGLPYKLRRGDGTPAAPLEAEAALRMQQLVWEVVTSIPQTGLAPMTGQKREEGASCRAKLTAVQ
ncbi:hypothetical protein JNB88_26820 [Rhizobium cauense]|uniref:hypothetical protein n=1 Tax=Rhizobium cauense TaxID=1166683 RepID=UPI001C6DFE60|nr:hypothetical protein [Rhizobium cauense]MBW9117238.1 hypothetical protein [Rhizobium cauense]